MTFDEAVQKVLDEVYNPFIKVENFIKVSKINNSLYKKMKSEVKKFIKINNEGYNLKLDMINFEAYFSKGEQQISFSLFSTSDERIVVIDNMQGSFYVFN